MEYGFGAIFSGRHRHPTRPVPGRWHPPGGSGTTPVDAEPLASAEEAALRRRCGHDSCWQVYRRVQALYCATYTRRDILRRTNTRPAGDP